MAEYGKILLIAMPAFLILIIIEKVYGWAKGNDTVPLDDASIKYELRNDQCP